MPILKGLEWTFDTVASTYEKMRPGYVDALYQKLFAYKPIDESSRVLEIGSGAGQATGPLLKTGCQLTAVEYGAHFSELLKEKFKDYPNFSVITGKFEDTPLNENAFDLVYSASAFHWIPEEIGYKKVFFLLKSGGAFARFANHPCRDKSNPALSKAIDELYDQYYYKFYPNKQKPSLKEYGVDEARERAMIAKTYGFTDIEYALFHRERIFSAKEYIQLMSTYSDHIAMEETLRTAFYEKVEAAINRCGGSITIYDTIDLQLAKKP